MRRRRRSRRKSSPERLGAVLDRWLDHNAESKKITQYTIHDRWVELVGERLATHTSPRALRKGVLTVMVDNSAWLNELSFMRADLVRQINSGLGKRLVMGIRMFAGKVDPLPPPEVPPRVEALKEVPLHLVEAVERETADIEDPELREAIRGARLAELRREEKRLPEIED